MVRVCRWGCLSAAGLGERMDGAVADNVSGRELLQVGKAVGAA